MRRVRAKAARDPKVALLRWVRRRGYRGEQVIPTLWFTRPERVLCSCGRKLNAALGLEEAGLPEHVEVTCDRCGRTWSFERDDLYSALQRAWFVEPRDGAVRLPLG